MAKPLVTMKVSAVTDFLDEFAPEDLISISKVRGTNVLMVQKETGEHVLRFEKKRPEKPDKPEETDRKK